MKFSFSVYTPFFGRCKYVFSKNQFFIQLGQLPHKKTSAGLRKHKVSFYRFREVAIFKIIGVSFVVSSDKI